MSVWSDGRFQVNNYNHIPKYAHNCDLVINISINLLARMVSKGLLGENA